MSENRKILIAKRKTDRNKSNEFVGNCAKNYNQDHNLKKGIKRPIPSTAKKNLANDRLKRLRTSLHEELQNSGNQLQKSLTKPTSIKTQINSLPASSCCPRKRPPNVNVNNQNVPDSFVTKVPKRNICDPQRNISGTTSCINSTCESDSEINFKVEVKQKNILTTADTTANQRYSSNLPQLHSTSTEESMEWTSTEDNDPTNNTFNSTIITTDGYNNSGYFYIVVDTNIFISKLQCVRNIVEMDITGRVKPVIYIPWMVFEELDFIKDDSKKSCLKWKAQEAIKYINKNFADKNERIMGQTLNEVNEQSNTGKNQDSKIIACSLQVLEKWQNMALLTDDINLKNKAHVNNIPVCSYNEILNKIVGTRNNQAKSQIILQKMTCLCSAVIKERASKAYGHAYTKMQIHQNIPRTIQDCIKIFTKYWFPVFQEVLMKQFKKAIKDLSSFLINNNTIKDDSKELHDLLKLCMRVCVFLKDIDSCKIAVENTICELNGVKES